MNRFDRWRFKAVLLLLALLGSSGSRMNADEGADQKWEDYPTEEISRIMLSKTFSDAEQVVALTYHLDKRISLAPSLKRPKGTQVSPGREYKTLINHIVEHYWKHTARPEVVAAVLANLDRMPNIKNKEAVRSLLYVALALAGGDAPENELLRMLNDPDTPQEIVYQILGGMLGSKRPQDGKLPGFVEVTNCPSRVPLRALPRLLELVEHPWSDITGGDVIGTHDVRERIYPIRELAYACLLELGVKAEKVTVPSKGVDEDGDPQISVTEIRVDKASAKKKLRELK